MNQSALSSKAAAIALAKATLRAGQDLGLTQTEVGLVVGLHCSSIARGLDPASKAGQLAALLVRVHRSLFALVGGDPAAMRHWMATENRHTGAVPARQVRRPEGLVHVLVYLDDLRNAA